MTEPIAHWGKPLHLLSYQRKTRDDDGDFPEKYHKKCTVNDATSSQPAVVGRPERVGGSHHYDRNNLDNEYVCMILSQQQFFYSVDGKCYRYRLRRHRSLFCLKVMLLWRCGKDANCQLTDVTQATLGLWKAVRSKNTPAIATSGRLPDCHFKLAFLFSRAEPDTLKLPLLP